MFGHHLGIDPTDDKPTWRFEFEIVPMKTKTNPLAVESNQQQSATTDVKLFSVPVTAEVPFDLTGYVRVYALEADQAFEKVQLQIDTDTLDDDLEMEEADWLCRLPYGQVKFCYGVNIGINRSDIELIENDVDPADVLKVEVKELHERVAWNAQKLARHKAFLASLIESAAAA